MTTFNNNALYMVNTFSTVKKVCNERQIECEQINDREFTINMDKVREIKRYEMPNCLHQLTTRKDGK